MNHRSPCLINLTLLLTLTTFTACKENQSRKVLVDLRALPEAFTDDKLPSMAIESSNKTCYSLMGCYKKLPILVSPSDPMSLKTTFTIIHANAEHGVSVERCINCLKNKSDDCDEYPFDLQSIVNSPFKPERRTVIIIGGYRSKGHGAWELRMKELWSQLDDVNVILVGWESSNNKFVYQEAAANTRPVARQLTVLLYYLAKLKGDSSLGLDNDVYMERFYLIGHSLGAHISGFVGSDVAGKLGRITGLDPAGPTFDTLPAEYRLDMADARFVDVLHTNAGAKIFSTKPKFGTALDSGHIDLWANDGQHQPGCQEFATEISCSHKRAPQYYESFLNDVLDMRKYLAGMYRPMYRLRAYSSDTFEEFQDGSSLAARCPIATLEDHDLDYTDLAKCSIPIDYVSWYSDYRAELETLHGINFSQTVTTSKPNKFFFYTGASSNAQLDHYMIKIRVTKATTNGAETRPGTDKGCPIEVNIKMANGFDTSTRINNYKLLDLGDHYEVMFPFLAPNSINKYEIAKMDSQDFYIERRQSDRKEFISTEGLQYLRKSIDQVFPSSVTLSGFKQSGDGKRKKRNWLDSIKRFFSGEESNDDEDGNGKKMEVLKGVNCELPIESFIVQPLRKFHRHLSAFYSRDRSDNNQTDLEVNVMLLGEDEPSPKALLFDEAKTGDAGDPAGLKISLTTVIIGPLLAVERDEDTEEEPLTSSDSSINAEMPKNQEADSQDKSGHKKFWLVLFMILLAIVLLMILISVLTMRPAKIDKLVNRDSITMASANLNYSGAYFNS